MRLDLFLLILAVIAAVILLGSYICFYIAFYVPKKRPPEEEYPIPPGKVYEPFRDTMVSWMKEVRAMPHENMTVTSFDGLRLSGKYYEYAPGAPIELMFHGYRGNAERDLCGGVQRSFALGHSALIVDQRTSGASEGQIISFGINESLDCQTWIDFMIHRFGADVRIILTGISMGAATVLIAAGRELPDNVIGVLADCGYSSAREIIMKTIRQMHLPARPLYPLVRLGARLYGRFDPDETSPEKAMRVCRVPVIFIHGEADDFVPCEMSRINYEACVSRKTLVTFPNAGHGAAYLVDPDGYIAALKTFWNA